MIKKIITYISFIIILVWTIGLSIFAWKINHFKSPETSKTDAIIVLTGGRNRISEAVKILENGVSDLLFISGVAKDISLKEIQNINKISLLPNKKITIGHNASNTVENAVETTEWIKKTNIKSIRLVTSNYHIMRSYLEFRKQNPELEIIIHPVYSEKIQKKWWTSWRTFSLISEEYNKVIYVYCRNLLNL
jgi:uncharacterized SAM-binding protein YcdF (DUF218 family)